MKSLIFLTLISMTLLASEKFYELKDRFEHDAIDTSYKYIINDNYDCVAHGLTFEREIKEVLRITKRRY